MCLFSERNCDRDRSTVCQSQSVFPLVRYLISLRFQACLCARRVLVMINVRKVSCSCGHVFITKRSKPHLTAKSGSKKHTMSSFRALETDEQAADRMSVDRACNYGCS